MARAAQLLPPSEMEGEKPIPTVRLTIGQLKAMVDENRGSRPPCPETFLAELMKTDNPEARVPEIRRALSDITKAVGTGADEPFYTLYKERGAKLFIRHTGEIVEIARAAGKESSAAFLELRSGPVSYLFDENPQAFVDLAKAVGTNSSRAFEMLSNSVMREAFARDPQYLIRRLLEFSSLANEKKTTDPLEMANYFYVLKDAKTSRLFLNFPKEFMDFAKVVGVSNWGAFEALSSDAISREFERNPKRVISIFSELAKVSDESYRLFYGISGERESALFLRHVDEVIAVAKSFGPNAWLAFCFIFPEESAREFEKNPKKIIDALTEIAKNAGPNVHGVLENLYKKEVCPLFYANIEGMVELSRRCGPHTAEAYEALADEQLGAAFSKEPMRIINAFSEMAKACGEGTPAFMALTKNDQLCSRFLRRTQDFVDLAKATGPGAYEAFGALWSSSVENLFEKDPKKVIESFAKIAKVTGPGASEAFHAIYQSFEYEFGKKPKRIIDGFERIAEATGIYAAAAFKALNTFSYEFLEDPKDVARLFSEIVRAAGTSSNDAFLAICGQDKLKEALMMNPKPVLDAFRAISGESGPNVKQVFFSLSREAKTGKTLTDVFITDPMRIGKALARMAASSSANSSGRFREFDILNGSPKIVSLFSENPERTVDFLLRLGALDGEFPVSPDSVIKWDEKLEKASKALLKDFQDVFLKMAMSHDKDAANVCLKGMKNKEDWLIELQNMDNGKLTNYFQVYLSVFNFLRGINLISEAWIFKGGISLDKLASETKSSETFSSSLRLLSSLDPALAEKYAKKVKVDEKWLVFTETRLDDRTLPRASAVGNCLYYLNSIFPYDKRFWEMRKKFGKAMEKAEVDKSLRMPTRTLGELEEVYRRFAAFEETAPEIYQRITSIIIRGVDFTQLVRSASGGTKLDPGVIEKTRLKLNEVNKVLGDEFVLSVGVNLSNEPITRANVLSKLDEVEKCFFSNPSQYEDVNRLYEMVGRFQANKIADFLVRNAGLFKRVELEEIVGRLRDRGIAVDFEDSAVSKILWNVGHGRLGYVVQKGIDKVTASDALRDSIVTTELKVVESRSVKLAEGFRVLDCLNGSGEKVATLISGMSEGGAKARYNVDVGMGIDVGSFKSEQGGSLVALSVGAFTTGDRKLADFAALDGDVTSYLVSNRDGLVFFYPDGTLEVKNAKTLKKSDIRTPGFLMSDEPMQFRDRVDEFDIFIQKIRKSKASVMQCQLLLHDGQLQVSPNSSGVQDKRRMLAVMQDGSFALIDFERHITLLEGAVLAQKMGVKHLVNLDTGMYDFSQYVDRNGRVHKLGTFDSERPTNLVYFTTSQSK